MSHGDNHDHSEMSHGDNHDHSEYDGDNEGLDEMIWAALPDALVDQILTFLPPASLARLRSVCKRWNELPSSPGWLHQYAEVARRPSCTVMCRLGFTALYNLSYFASQHGPPDTGSFFCHSERKWFGMPPLGQPQEAGASRCFEWVMADVNWGLVCYASYERSGLWLCVSNPLTKAKTVLPPPLVRGSFWDARCSEFAKLVVDRQTRTYKIVVLHHSGGCGRCGYTLVYNSATALWTVLEGGPALWNVLLQYSNDHFYDKRPGVCFLWKRTIFMQCMDPLVLQTFDVDTEVWREVKIQSTGNSRKRYHFVNNHNRFMIIRSYANLDLHDSTTPISMLTLKDDSASPFPLCEDDKWVEVDVRNRANLHKVISVARCDTNHNDCIIVTYLHTNQWITYNFKTRTWREMPSRNERNKQYSWYDWEPRWDVETGPDPSPIVRRG